MERKLIAVGVRYKALRVAANGDCLLNLSGTATANLSPLVGLPVTHLCLQGCFGIRDFLPLTNMNLVWLNLSRTSIRDLSPLHTLPLQYLRLWRTSVDDLSPLRRTALRSLDIRFSQVKDLSSLRDAPLEEILLYPKHVTMGLNVLGRIRTLKRINGRPARVFCKRYRLAK